MIYVELMLVFLQIGAFTFGGGYAMLPLIQQQVAAHGWLTQKELIDFIAVSESTPGPFAVNVSTYVGMETGGWLGAVMATLGVILPSFIIILVIAGFFDRFKNSAVVKGCMKGLKPAVVGLIAAAVISTGKTVFCPEGMKVSELMSFEFISAVLIFLIMLLMALKNKHPILIIILSGVLGICAGYGAGL